MIPLAPAPLNTLLSATVPDAWAKWFRDVAAMLGFDQNHSRTVVPAFTGLTIVGAVAQSLVYLKDRNMVAFLLHLEPSGGGTVASTAGTTLLSNLPYTASHDGIGIAVNAVSLAVLGGTRVAANTKNLYLPTFAATANKVVISGWYRTEA